MLVLHIGLPKTATTFLQHRVLGRSPGLTFVHRRRGPAGREISLELRRFARAEPLRYLARRGELPRLLAQFAAGLPEGPDRRLIVVSEESVSVSATGFWRNRGARPDRLARRLAWLARRLEGDLRPLRVLIGIRRQDRWLASRYAESSRAFPEFSQADFDRRMTALAEVRTLDGPLAWLDACAVRGSFAAALGPENVMLLPLERLAVAENETLAALGDFLGIPLARPADAPARRPARRINQLAAGDDVWRLRRDGSPLRLEPSIQAALVARFAASNSDLAAAVPLGYDP